MNESSAPLILHERTPRLVATFGFLVMVVLGAWSNVAVLGNYIVSDDRLGTASNLLENESVFRFAIVAIIMIGILDIVAAWALHEMLRDRSPALSLLAAVFRYVYAGILLVAATFLTLAGGLIGDADAAEDVDIAFMQSWLDAFSVTWAVGFLVLSFNLLVLGWVIQRTGVDRGWVVFGWLSIIAGTAYLLSAVLLAFGVNPGLDATMFAFVGEVVILAWLIWIGFRRK